MKLAHDGCTCRISTRRLTAFITFHTILYIEIFLYHAIAVQNREPRTSHIMGKTLKIAIRVHIRTHVLLFNFISRVCYVNSNQVTK